MQTAEIGRQAANRSGIQALSACGDGGEPIHDRGIVESEPGLYLCGLHFQFAAPSDSIVGMQRDARFVMKHHSIGPSWRP